MIGDVLKNLRLCANMTQQELADLLGVKRSTYAYYELGKVKPPLAVITKLSVVFRVSADAILAGTPRAVLRDSDAPNDTDDAMFLGRLTKAERELILRLRLAGDDGSRAKAIMNSLSKSPDFNKEGIE